MSHKFIWATLLLLITVALTGCNNNREYEPERPVTPIYEFPQVCEAESDGSSIAFDSTRPGICFIINNREQLEALIPADVRASDPAYSAIDFATQSLVSVRYVNYFYLDSLSFRLFMAGNDSLIILIENTKSSFDIAGKRFYMGNFVVPKLPSDTPYLVMGA